MIRKHEPRVPEGVDVTRPSIARIYDYLLFGKDIMLRLTFANAGTVTVIAMVTNPQSGGSSYFLN